MDIERSDKDVVWIEDENFKRNLLQIPITFLTEENLSKLEEHCLKAMRYERGIEHKVVLELLEKYKEFLAEREEDKKKIEELEDRCKSHQKLLYEAAEVEKNSIPKQKVKEIFDRLHISDIEPWSTYKVSGDILFDLKELLEDK